MRTPAESIAGWKPRIDWPELDPEQLVKDALTHVRDHQWSVAEARDIPDDLMRRGSSCPRKAVTNYVREEHSSYPLVIESLGERLQGRARERLHSLRELARDKVNRLISLHYAATIDCSCGHCAGPADE